ncbi:MAG: RraA family protein [Kiritimatiellaeota bacterium]|nr:RraA family protein [Kiritimatiellota bacterium]
MKQINYYDMLRLKRWNTPTIYNGWEAISKHANTDPGCFNTDETRDFMPQMGVMVGRAVTVVIEPSNPAHKAANAENPMGYYEYIAGVEGPKIVIVQDLDKPAVIGSFWGEINSNLHKALGCLGTITDGAIRDVDEMTNVGFKAIARRFCVGHANVCPIKWGCDVTVFGCVVKPGQLIHADKHGFMAIPPEDEERLLDASLFLDNNELNAFVKRVSLSSGMTRAEILRAIVDGKADFTDAYAKKFKGDGEW